MKIPKKRKPLGKTPGTRRTGVPLATRAVIMAGGMGTRLRPYTTLIPKPLAPIGDRPILEFVLRRLKSAGFERATLCVGHLAQLIQAYFGDGNRWGIELDYCVEDKPLSTIGPLAFVDDLSEDFLVMNGDILTDLDLAKVFRAHKKNKAELTVATHAREVQIDYGVLQYEPRRHRIRSYTEKPSIPYEVSMGIYILNRKCLEFVKPGRALGFDQLVHKMLAKKRRVMAYPYQGRWLDVGRPEDYELAQGWEEKP